MRGCLFVMSAILLIGLAFWAYRENYETQSAQARATALQSEIASARERLRMLNAEWAYLNRPDRLRDLAQINFDRLGLLPLRADQFGPIDQVAYPPIDLLPILNPVELMAREDNP
ncbi:MAG: cell division protein FtsL [Pseudomonadota bacterium]